MSQAVAEGRQARLRSLSHALGGTRPLVQLSATPGSLGHDQSSKRFPSDRGDSKSPQGALQVPPTSVLSSSSACLTAKPT